LWKEDIYEIHPNMSDFTAPSLINWLIEQLESAQDTEYVDLTEMNKKYKAKATGLSVGNSLIFFSLMSKLSKVVLSMIGLKGQSGTME
jgi:hypothetical protein